jgi:hypothetical protein
VEEAQEPPPSGVRGQGALEQARHGLHNCFTHKKQSGRQLLAK